jgi:hypothetical protein
MADQRRDVDAETELREPVKPCGHVQLRSAAVAGDDRRDAVEQEVLGARIALEVASTCVWTSMNPERRRAPGVDGARGSGAASCPTAAILPSSRGRRGARLPLLIDDRPLRISRS